MPAPSLEYTPSISRVDLAKGFLFSACETADYITPYPGWGPFIQYLPTLLSTSAKQSSLQVAVEALAFCVMSPLPSHSAYARLANLSYGAALRRINLAISDANESLSDETLMATLLMSIYEVQDISQVDGSSTYHIIVLPTHSGDTNKKPLSKPLGRGHKLGKTPRSPSIRKRPLEVVVQGGPDTNCIRHATQIQGASDH